MKLGLAPSPPKKTKQNKTTSACFPLSFIRYLPFHCNKHHSKTDKLKLTQNHCAYIQRPHSQPVFDIAHNLQTFHLHLLI